MLGNTDTSATIFAIDDEAEFVQHWLQVLGRNASDSDIWLFQQFFLLNRPISEVAHRLHTSTFDVKERLRALRQQYSALKDSLQPPHAAD